MLKKKIGVLCTIDGPLVTRSLQAIIAGGFGDLYLVADLKGFGSTNLNRFLERTNRFFESPSLSLGHFAAEPIPVYFVDSHNDDACISLITSMETDLLINLGTPRKLSGTFLNSVKCDVLNVHPGVLPKYRGSSCVEWAILNNDPIGNSAHFMTEEYDAGPIILVEEYQFCLNSSYADIRTLVYLKSISLMVSAIALVFRDSLVRRSMVTEDIRNEAFPAISYEKMLIVYQKIAANDHYSICQS